MGWFFQRVIFFWDGNPDKMSLKATRWFPIFLEFSPLLFGEDEPNLMSLTGLCLVSDEHLMSSLDDHFPDPK